MTGLAVALEKHQLTSVIYGGKVSSRLHFAQQLFRQYGQQLHNNQIVADALQALCDCQTELVRHMAGMGMTSHCLQCVAANGGGCCSHFMAGETDGLQLLMNILVGVDVKRVRDDNSECRYLGEHGCIFRFKPMFCLNYNCQRILTSSTASSIRQLEQQTGKLLGRQYAMEQLLLATLSNT